MTDPHREALELLDPALIEQPGPWPATHVDRTSTRPIRLDVDRFRDLAVVVSILGMPSEGRVQGDNDWRMVHGSVFRRLEDKWHHVGGGGGGSDCDPLTERYEPSTWDRPLRPDIPEALRNLIQWGGESFCHGTSGMVLVPGIGQVQHSRVLCAPHVATVVVERGDETRTASVSSGPGWIGVVWPDSIHPILRAYDESDRERTRAELGELTVGTFNEVFRQLRGDSNVESTAQAVFTAGGEKEWREGSGNPEN